MTVSFLIPIAVVVCCAVLTSVLIVILTPTFARHFMAEPNERSSHQSPVPQGAGLAIMASMLAVYVPLWGLGHLQASQPWPVPLLGAAVGLTILGALDDAMSVPVTWRLAGQAAAAFAIVLSLPDSLQLFPGLVPLPVERLALVIGTVGFINAVNFLDGIDWITVAQTVPICLAVIVMRYLGVVPENVGLLALVLLGGVLGFALFNRHPAQIFLGDGGSLPIGLCLAWLLIFVAKADLTAAVLLPLYTIADAGVTLAQRIARRERIFAAHRTHFYQRAITLGFKAPDVTTRVFLLGSFNAALAIIAVLAHGGRADLGLLALGIAATVFVLRGLSRGRQ